MAMMQQVSVASDRVMAALIAGLEIEFGTRTAEALAHRFIAAEEADFCWDARTEERWLGSYWTDDEDYIELDRVAIFGMLDNRWFVAVCVIDGDEMAHGMIGKRDFDSAEEARAAFRRQH